MLSVQSLSKFYGIEPILQDVSFTLNAGERLGLVGDNGSGKTTLLRILAGLETPNSGGFRLNPPDLSLGYLQQGYIPREADTVAAFIDRSAGEIHSLSQQLQGVAEALAKEPERADLLWAYDDTLKRLEIASQNKGEVATVLDSLGLNALDPKTPVASLSGGQKTRLGLAALLLSAPQLLLLDEPTNHLDIGMLEWLENWLITSPLPRSMAILIVSHDRAFLDHTVSGILELDKKTHHVRSYPGNYSDYIEQKLAEVEQHWQEYGDWREEIVRLRSAAQKVRGQAAFHKGGKGDSGDKFAKGFFGNRSRRTVARAKSLEARIDRLLTEDRIDKPRLDWQLKLDFGGAPASGRDVVMLENLAIGYGERILLSDINCSIRYGQRVVLIGSNGSGKTTLVRTIAGLLPPLHGRARLGSEVRVGYMAQEQDIQELKENALITIRSLAPFSETEARAFLHQFLFSGDDVFTPTEQLSYGERARLMLACLTAGGCNLLLLDEPINHLDVPSRTRFETALRSFQGTVIAVVHDRYFIDSFATQIWEIKEDALSVIHLEV